MVAGFLCKIVEYPIDTLKVQVQTQSRWSHPSQNPSPPPLSNGPVHLFLTLVRRYTVLWPLSFIFPLVFSSCVSLPPSLCLPPYLSVLAEGKIDRVGVCGGVHV
jgi:hypothetical protein